MKICLANTGDIEKIAALEKECFADPYTEEQLLYEISENPVSQLEVYKENHEIIGYIDYWITFDSATICKIAVKKEYRRKGIGAELLENSFKKLVKNEVSFYTLEVRKSNVNAISFYEKYGFKLITTKKGYYADGEDALYMMRGMI